MKLFISYRRSDSTHAAQRVRMCLQEKFGADAVFIDREIPPGIPWEQHLEAMLAGSTGVIVMIGDAFLKLLKRHQSQQPGDTDPLVWEIATAIRLGKPIYPVLFGAIDMPDAAKLPEAIRKLPSYQAVFAREPAFDAAVAELIKSIAEQHGDLAVLAPPAPAAAPAANGKTGIAGPSAAGPANQPATTATPWLALATTLPLLAVAGLWGTGRVLLWLADPNTAPQRPAESAFWHGLRYALTTLLWGLGPYLAWWMVAQLRARARLPIYNLHGMLSAANVGGMMVTGGSFLLLSTLDDWVLKPLWLFPAQPAAWHYIALALLLLTVVVCAVLVAIWEPHVRTLEATRRAVYMQVINTVSAAVAVFGFWFAASMAWSLPGLNGASPVPVVGYLMLCPTLSLLAAGWAYGRSLSGLSDRVWQIKLLMGLMLGIYAVGTLALFAFGPTRLLAAGG